MTLNITVISKKAIYQSADFRFTDTLPGEWRDAGENKKIYVMNAERWSATVCFNGVASTRSVNVSDWLTGRIAAISPDDPLDRLFDELKTADDWLRNVPPPHNLHSFVVGAFDGSRPVYGLVSNYETPTGEANVVANSALAVHRDNSPRSRTYVAGQRGAVDRETRGRLCNLANIATDRSLVMDALAAANRVAAARNSRISKGCYVASLLRNGEGGAHSYDIPTPFQREPLVAGIVKALGINPSRIVGGIGFTRVTQDDSYWEIQLADHANDPSVLSNYGAYLMDMKKDLPGARAAFQKALRLKPDHVLALSNLGTLLHREGDIPGARGHFKRALKTDPASEPAAFGYARVLVLEEGDYTTAIDLLDKAIERNSMSGRLVVLRARATLLKRHYSAALDWYRRSRETGVFQEEVEAGYAIALHQSGGEADDVIDAYRTAIALNPQGTGLKVNLAQVLLANDREEGGALLSSALESELPDEAKLEAEFYRLTHQIAPAGIVLPELMELVARGVQLNWDVKPNVEYARARDPVFGAAVEQVASALASKDGIKRLKECRLYDTFR